MIEQIGEVDAVERVARELAQRRSKNPRYSLRGFAQSMGLSHSVLSLFLSKRRSLSASSALRVARELGLSETEIPVFVRAATRRLKREVQAEP